MSRWILCFFAFAFVAGCDNWLTKPSMYGSVSVVATRRNGDVIPGVDLVLYTGPRPMGYGLTDAAGRFTFTQVPQGSYGIVAKPPTGFSLVESLIQAPPSNVVQPLAVNADSSPAVRFVFLKPGPGTVVARLAQRDGTPLVGVPVTLYDPRAIHGKVNTDAAGRAVFNAVPYGVYGVIAERPFLYRDFAKPGDSLYASRDNIIVDEGVRDSIAIALPKCAGTIRVLAVDDAGAPVRGATTIFYTAFQQLGVVATGADGRASLGDLPCALQVGVSVGPPAGYSLTPGRGSSFYDGIALTNGQVLDFTFRLRRGF